MAGVAAVDDVADDGVADLAGLVGGADDRDGARLEDALHRAQDLLAGEPGRRLGRREVQHEPQVGRHGAGGRGEHRVEVGLGDLGEVGDQVGEPGEDVGQPLAVHRRAAADPVQHLGGPGVAHLGQGVLAGDRGQAEGDVLEDLDQYAAQAEHHDLAEGGVGGGADDDLGAAADHLLDLHALDGGVGVVGAGVADDALVGGLDLLGGGQPHLNAAGLGLVQDVGGDDLGDDRQPQLHGQRDRFVGAGGQRLAGDRDSVGLGEDLALGRGQRAAVLGARPVQHRPYGVAVVAGGGFRGHVFRSLRSL